MDKTDWTELKQQIAAWSANLGFQAMGVAPCDLSGYEPKFEAWLARGEHGEMGYMSRHGSKRTRPAELEPGTRRIISVRMDYLPQSTAAMEATLHNPRLGYVARYALGRDYHKLMRKRLQHLATLITGEVGEFGYRVFVDSAPVLEKPLGELAGLGWSGKHTNLISRTAGSWFFLGEIFTDLPLPIDTPAANHCGECTRCIDICPTRAIVAPYHLDARLCISYLTIEHHGAIPVALRPLMGNRIYGCDDCQIVCPWNRFAQLTQESDFLPRHGLDTPQLIELAQWHEEDFNRYTEGSPIRRLGHARWLRNICVALGNGDVLAGVEATLRQLSRHDSELVAEHAAWGLNRLSI